MPRARRGTPSRWLLARRARCLPPYCPPSRDSFQILWGFRRRWRRVASFPSHDVTLRLASFRPRTLSRPAFDAAGRSRSPERRERLGRGPLGRTRARTRASPFTRPNSPGLGFFKYFNFSVVAVHTKVRKRPVHRLVDCFSCGLYPFHGLTRLSLSLRLGARLTLRFGVGRDWPGPSLQVVDWSAW